MAGEPGASRLCARDAEFEASILAKARELGFPRLGKEVSAAIAKRWETKRFDAGAELGKRFSSLAHAALRRVDHKNPEEVSASVMFLEDGAWRYRTGKGKESLPDTSDSITECYIKVYSGQMTDQRGNQWMSGNPREFASWRRLKWDAETKKWASVTGQDIRQAQAKHQEWIDRELSKAQDKAGRPPSPTSLKWAQGYAEQGKAEQAAWRLVIAYDPGFWLRALKCHAEEFKANPLPAVSREP
ncbi:MAG: hypothetical protein HY924_10050 [Elusimicrobia bacterium]|nr:hypothetical protein [Elusimicrobiota bacterium]